MSWHITPLFREYAVYGGVRHAIKQTFQSGLQQGSSQMVFILPPNRGVMAPDMLAPGTYLRTGPQSDYGYAYFVLAYFGKDVLVVAAADNANGFDGAPGTR